MNLNQKNKFCFQKYYNFTKAVIKMSLISLLFKYALEQRFTRL